MEVLQAINELFEGELTDGDMVSFFGVVKSKLLESATLRKQAAANTNGQLANSPNLRDELTNAVMDADAAHQSMSRQVLSSDAVLNGLLSALLGVGNLWEDLRKAGGPGIQAAA